MSLRPAFFGGRKRHEDQAPEPEPELEHDYDQEQEKREDVFNLIPPRADDAELNERLERLERIERGEKLDRLAADPFAPTEPYEAPAPKRAVAKASKSDLVAPSRSSSSSSSSSGGLPGLDLSRMSIDNHNQLYWDGKPVEVRRKLSLSTAQFVAATLVGVFMVIGAIGAAIQGVESGYTWACKLGWTTSYCAPLAPPPPHQPVHPDIPA